jgi:hypothetical protein
MSNDKNLGCFRGFIFPKILLLSPPWSFTRDA